MTKQDDAPRVQHIIADRAHQGLPRHITDAATLDRIAVLIARDAARLLERDKDRLPVLDAARRRRIVSAVALDLERNKRSQVCDAGARQRQEPHVTQTRKP